MNTLQILKDARELLSDPARWTRDHYARDKYGNSKGPQSAEAVCWCTTGALYKAANKDPMQEHGDPNITEAMRALNRSLTGNCTLTQYNDAVDHTTILSLFDRTIQRLSIDMEEPHDPT